MSELGHEHAFCPAHGMTALHSTPDAVVVPLPDLSNGYCSLHDRFGEAFFRALHPRRRARWRNASWRCWRPSSLIDKVVVTPAADGTLQVELHGEMAALLMTATSGVVPSARRPTSAEDGRAVLSVVTGKRNQRYLQASRARILQIARVSGHRPKL
jgi:hypothetical protein